MYFPRKSLRFSDRRIRTQLHEDGHAGAELREPDRIVFLDEVDEPLACALTTPLGTLPSAAEGGTPSFRDTAGVTSPELTTRDLAWEHVLSLAKGRDDAELLLEATGEDTTRYFALRWFTFGTDEPRQHGGRDVLLERANELVTLFIECARDEADLGGTPEHIANVKRFQAHLEAFYRAYPDQSVGTVAAYVSRRGIPQPVALVDILRIDRLYRE